MLYYGDKVKSAKELPKLCDARYKALVEYCMKRHPLHKRKQWGMYFISKLVRMTFYAIKGTKLIPKKSLKQPSPEEIEKMIEEFRNTSDK